MILLPSFHVTRKNFSPDMRTWRRTAITVGTWTQTNPTPELLLAHAGHCAVTRTPRPFPPHPATPAASAPPAKILCKLFCKHQFPRSTLRSLQLRREPAVMSGLRPSAHAPSLQGESPFAAHGSTLARHPSTRPFTSQTSFHASHALVVQVGGLPSPLSSFPTSTSSGRGQRQTISHRAAVAMTTHRHSRTCVGRDDDVPLPASVLD